MAEIVLGLGTSHSPMLSLPPELWHLFEERDKGNRMLTSVPDGEVMSYESLLEQADPSIAARITPETFRTQHDACQKAITTLEKTLDEAEPDAWTIEAADPHAHVQGAAGVYGFTPQSRFAVYLDNLSVTPNE